ISGGTFNLKNELYYKYDYFNEGDVHMELELKGWEYIGRNLGGELHNQFLKITGLLRDPVFLKGRTWGGQIQQEIGDYIGISPGQVRTIKRMLEQLGIIPKGVLEANRKI